MCRERLHIAYVYIYIASLCVADCVPCIEQRIWALKSDEHS